MDATENPAAFLHAVADDPAAAARAVWREGVDGAFEAVEDVGFPAHNDLEALIVIVTAHFAFSHGKTFTVGRDEGKP